MSYPHQVPPTKGDWDRGTRLLAVFGVGVFLAGCFVFVKSETPTGGLVAGVLISVSVATVACAGLEMPKR